MDAMPDWISVSDGAVPGDDILGVPEDDVKLIAKRPPIAPPELTDSLKA